MIIDATICTRMLGTRMLAVSDYRCHYMYKRFFFRSLFVDHMHACEGWPDSVYRWTEPPWASWRRCWTLRCMAGEWSCVPSTRPTRAWSTVMFTPVARNGLAISSTRSLRSTLSKKRPRTGTNQGPCHRNPSLWRGQEDLAKMTVSLK